MITTDQLFAEKFVPEWQTHKERIELLWWLIQLCTVAWLYELFQTPKLEIISRGEFEYQIITAYRSSAAESRLRLASRTDRRCNYSNA